MELPYNGSFSNSIGPLITSHSKSLYGDETKFPALKQAAISELSELILGMRNTNDPNNFKTVLAKAAKLRHEIAVDTETPESPSFGAPREDGEFMSTLLSTEKYQAANEKTKELVLKCLTYFTDKTATKRMSLGNSRYTFKLLQEDPLILKDDPFANFAKMQNGQHNEANESDFALSHLIDYKQNTLPLRYALEGKTISKREITLDKNLYIFQGKVELKTNNEWRTLTRHYTVLKCNDAGEIDIEDFKANGLVALLHTSFRDIPLHDKPMSQLFNQILNAPSDQLDTLIREFEYRLHHICYFIRGSATTSEIILESLKNTLHPTYTPKSDLDAFTEPLLPTYLKG